MTTSKLDVVFAPNKRRTRLPKVGNLASLHQPIVGGIGIGHSVRPKSVSKWKTFFPVNQNNVERLLLLVVGVLRKNVLDFQERSVKLLV